MKAREVLSVLGEMMLSALFPKRCSSCDKLISFERNFCEECAAALESVEDDFCIRCGRGKSECACPAPGAFFSAVVSPLYYSGSAKSTILRLKSGKEPKNADVLAAIAAERIKGHMDIAELDLITCVPLSREAMKRRGYNQSELIARGISKRIGIPFEAKALVRTFQIEQSKALPGLRRAGNVFGAFEVAKEAAIKDKRILLCDDVLTTGATLNECAKMLMLSGAADVKCVAAAVTHFNKKDKKEAK